MSKVIRDGLIVLLIMAVMVMVPAHANLVATTFGFPVIVQNGSTSAFNQDVATATDLEALDLNFPVFGQDLALGPTQSTNDDPPMASYTTPGTYTYTVPEGVYSVTAIIVGGGGGGGGGGGSGQWSTAGGGGGGGGGGSGDVVVQTAIPVEPGQKITVVVGKGGIGGSGGERGSAETTPPDAGSGGSAGGSSSFGAYIADGGKGGDGGGGAYEGPDHIGENGAPGQGGTGTNSGKAGSGMTGGDGGAGYANDGATYGAGGTGGDGGSIAFPEPERQNGQPGDAGDSGAVLIMAPDEASYNVLPFGPVNLAFPSISQTVVQTQNVSHTDFAQTNEFAEFAYPFVGVGPVCLPGFGFGW